MNNSKEKTNKKALLILFVFLFITILTIIVFYAVSLGKNSVETQEIFIKNPKEKTKEVVNKKKNNIINNMLNKTIIGKYITQQQKKSNKKTNKNNNNNNSNSEVSTEEQIDPGIFSVRDDSEKWETNTELKIFNKVSESFIRKGKIAPGAESNYKFIIRNNNDFAVYYSITFLEDNTQGINMLYKVKRNNNYLLNASNQWITINNEKIIERELLKGNKDEYTLNWKWFNSSNDTALGIDGNVSYKLIINVEVEEKAWES